MDILKALNKKTRTYNYLATAEEYERIKEKAEKYTRGKVSTWIRYAALNYVPKKDELTVAEEPKRRKKS
jgi:hypothetical protein